MVPLPWAFVLACLGSRQIYYGALNNKFARVFGICIRNAAVTFYLVGPCLVDGVEDIFVALRVHAVKVLLLYDKYCHISRVRHTGKYIPYKHDDIQQ